MKVSIEFRKISCEQWLGLVEKMKLDSLSANPRVSNNIFHSMQWLGLENITRPDRTYYGVFAEEKLVGGFGIYFVSETVARVRNFFCEPEYRRKGFIRSCFQYAILEIKNRATKVIAFSTTSGIDFHLACGFRKIESWQPRPVEYFDFQTQKYVAVEDDLITLFEIKI